MDEHPDLTNPKYSILPENAVLVFVPVNDKTHVRAIQAPYKYV